MSYQIDNQEIGSYISGFIEREFKSARQFCKVYLQTNGIKEPAKEDIQNMANRLSQIKKKGEKAIQIYDLPIFSELLHVSVEQILSAGKCGEPILNPDEYGKTVLDYAIMFGNYDFLKFLANKNYIWFDSRKDNDVFVFPYISQLLDMLIENNSPFLKTASEKSIEHNESTKELSILQKRS